MNILLYEDLTPEERTFITNGCGVRIASFRVRSSIFEHLCRKHDFDYWKGFREIDRVRADRQFYVSMKAKTASLSWYKRPFYYWLAWTFYRLVRLFGKPFFRYDSSYRGRDELRREMEEEATE